MEMDKEIDKMIEVLTAFKEGKEIEFRRDASNDWSELKVPSWNFNTSEYRIKPQPEYIPFTWDDRDLFRDRWIRIKGEEQEFRVNNISKEFALGSTTYEKAFVGMEFIDGTPFGKLKQ